MIRLRSFRAPGVLLLALVLALVGCGPKVKLVNVIPASFSNEYHSDSEPNIAVNPADPRRIVISAFTPCPPFISAKEAPIYFSTNGGDTWYLNCIVPGNDPSAGTHDITIRFAGSSGVLYAGVLRGMPRDNQLSELNILRTSDFTSAMPMTLLRSRYNEDQPYTQADTHGDDDHVYIGNNNLADCDVIFCVGTTKRSSSLDSSPDAATPPPPAGFGTQILEDRETCGGDLPPVRPAVHHKGVIYLAYLHNELGSPCFVGKNTTDIVVARDDHWGTGGYKALVDPCDGKFGVRVAINLSMSWLGGLGLERVGDQLSIAVDPEDSQKVYVAWGDGANAGDFELHVRQSSDGGRTWSKSDLKTVHKATNPALAVNDDGRVGFLYQQLVKEGTCKGGPAVPCWETHFERLKGSTWRDLPHPLANVPDNAGNFPLGDYIHVMAVGDKFYGAFSANNYPDKANFYPGVKYQRHVDWRTHQLFGDRAHTMVVPSSVDPYFFTVSE